MLALVLAVSPAWAVDAPVFAGEPTAAKPVAEADAFLIPPALRETFRREVIDATRSPEARLRKLVEFVFDDRHLGVQYRADTTRTIAEVYATREVNCLSSTILIVALAREAGLRAYGQQVDQILAWGANGDIAIQSRHANAVVEIGDRRYVVDVDAREGIATRAPHQISDTQLLALFHGNRAMEQLVDGRLADAQSSIDAALRLSPDDAALLNNAGVTALRTGDRSAALQFFQRAAARNPREISVLSNLIAFYEAGDDEAQAAVWRARAARILRRDPYYQYALGRKLEIAGRYSEAATQFRMAARLNDNEHLFQFGLARTYAQLGDMRRATRALSYARALSEGADRIRYGDKLAALERRHTP